MFVVNALTWTRVRVTHFNFCIISTAVITAMFRWYACSVSTASSIATTFTTLTPFIPVCPNTIDYVVVYRSKLSSINIIVTYWDKDEYCIEQFR